jgi:hypothetical protein
VRDPDTELERQRQPSLPTVSFKFRRLRHGRQVPRRWARGEMRLRESAN